MGITTAPSGALMPFIYVHLCPPCLHVCSLTSALLLSPPRPHALPHPRHPPPCPPGSFLTTYPSSSRVLLPPPLSSTRSPLRGYLVAAPSVFRAGVEESVSVTIFNAKAETRVQVQLSVKGQTVAHGHGSVLGENMRRSITYGEKSPPKTCRKQLSHLTLMILRSDGLAQTD